MPLRLRATAAAARTPAVNPPPPPPAPPTADAPASIAQHSIATPSPPTHRHPSSTAQTLWDQSRRPSNPLDPPLPAGSSRPLTLYNVLLAFQIIRYSAFHLMLRLLEGVHPFRLLLFLVLNALRGLFPAFRTYSQVMLLDEVQLAVSQKTITTRLGWLLALEFVRMLCEAIFENFTTTNERFIQQKLRFHIEHAQLSTRLRLDIPALSSHTIQDLLTESDLFARSFNGIGGLGLLSPFDLVRTFVVVGSEVGGRAWVVWGLWKEHRDHSSTTGQGWAGRLSEMDRGQFLIVLTVLGPTILSLLNVIWNRWWSSPSHAESLWSSGSTMSTPDSSTWPQALYNPEEAETAETHERMRRLAYDDGYKSEIMLFGLSKWILKTWEETREKLLSAEGRRGGGGPGGSSSTRSRSARAQRRSFRLPLPVPIDIDPAVVVEFLRECTRELMLTLQAIPLILQLSTTTLGTATLYRSTLTSLLSSVQTLSHTFDQTYQGVFLLVAFHASVTAQPMLEPVVPVSLADTIVRCDSNSTVGSTDLTIASVTGSKDMPEGLKLDCRDLWFTYPGADEPTIRGLNLTIEKGEIVAVVGSNGSGKSTLMHLLLRLFAYDGEVPLTTDNDKVDYAEVTRRRAPRILINDTDARLFSPTELHSRCSAVFQGFCKFAGASVRENVAVGCVDGVEGDGHGQAVVERALKDGVALGFVQNMRDGIETRLDAGGFSSSTGGGASASFQLRRTPTSATSPGSPRQQKKAKVALSGGQWQRLALARLFTRGTSASSPASTSSCPPPSLILLDEASSQLDATAEHAVFARLRQRFPKATIVFITHRLETVRWADKVAFFEGGKVTEFGKHEDLVNAAEGYSKMWIDFEGGATATESEG